MGERGPLGCEFGVRAERRKRQGKILYLPGYEGIGRAKKPNWFGPYESEVWDAEAPKLEKTGRLNAIFEAGFIQICSLMAEHRRMNEQIEADGGEMITINGNMQVHPLVKSRNAHMRVLISYMKDYGMTPSSDRRVPRAAPVKKDPFWGKYK
ncbi:MAG: P27 family phage terminase small subunit [Acidobacteria bacterium]|nr:P27 family phage terminase small subunit [Acidobacteriota bacterium]